MEEFDGFDENGKGKGHKKRHGLPEKPDGIQQKADINGRSDGGTGVREGEQENEGGTGRRSGT